MDIDDQPDALRGAADGADVVGRHPDDHALLGNQEELIAVLDAGELVECGPTKDLLTHPKRQSVRELMDMPRRQAERVRALTAASGPS